jgi:hypothetical protein
MTEKEEAELYTKRFKYLCIMGAVFVIGIFGMMPLSINAEAPVKVAREATVQACLTSGHTIEECKAFK